MPRKNDVPAYLLHQGRGLARVRIDGKDIYLGKYGSPESKAEYDRVIAEHLTRRSRPAPVAPEADHVSVNRLVLAYLVHASHYYRGRDGKPTPEVANLKDALKPLRRLYGPTLAVDFGPLALEAVRAEMVRSGLARPTVNARVHRLRRAFRWAVSREMIPPSVVQALDAVASLAKHRTSAPEPPPVLPVADDVVEATLPHLPAPVAAMVRLQLLAGMRPAEVTGVRGCDLTILGDVWEYRPLDHKGEWRDGSRVVTLGPRAQSVLAPFLKPDPAAYLFDPRDAVAAHQAARGKARKSKRTPSERRKLRPRPGEARNERYDRRTYRQAVVRACDRAFPHPTISAIAARRRTPEQVAELDAWQVAHRWTPLQLRHSAATAIRAGYGLEAAQVVLGHARADVTQIYAEKNMEKAREVMREIG